MYVLSVPFDRTQLTHGCSTAPSLTHSVLGARRRNLHRPAPRAGEPRGAIAARPAALSQLAAE